MTENVKLLMWRGPDTIKDEQDNKVADFCLHGTQQLPAELYRKDLPLTVQPRRIL
ncbi:hypothetical protein GBAR_LOCUS21997 [Geodia barretti]|uniref:Uncharacterized protein n=1 Tax=Geodia barretti TaxID=519541 RepID=A0AA35WZC5_GEOBA|nr:hypothetical protein GBAR_LOCUS21997 [Geodia barretti]